MARPRKNQEATQNPATVPASSDNERLSVLEAQNRELAETVNRLMAALVGTRLEAPKSDDSELIEVKNVSGMALTATLDNNGHPRTFYWEGRDIVHKLTRKQLQELKDKAPHFFTKGYVSAPAFVADNPNIIHNIDEFIESLTLENVNSRVDGITSIDTLYLLYHHIENMRFSEEAVRDDNGELVLPEVQIDPLVMALQLAVAKKLNVLANVNVSLNM